MKLIKKLWQKITNTTKLPKLIIRIKNIVLMVNNLHLNLTLDEIRVTNHFNV